MKNNAVVYNDGAVTSTAPLGAEPELEVSVASEVNVRAPERKLNVVPFTAMVSLESCKDCEEEEGVAKKMPERLIQLGKKYEMFHDDAKEPYIIVQEEGLNKVLCIEGDDFQKLLSLQYYKEFNKAATKEALFGATNTLSALAKYDKPHKDLFVRFASKKDDYCQQHVYLDLANKMGQVVHISKDAWEIERSSEVLFVSNDHMLELPLPEKDRSFYRVFDFINVKKEDQLLLLAWIMSTLVSCAPTPSLIFFGPQGSGKSNASKMLKSLLDPSKLESVPLPKGEARMAHVLSRHALPVFDNLSSIDKESSDLLCKGVTGGGFSTRKLFTNKDETVLTYKRPMILNGINLPASMPDLLSRSLLLEIPPLLASQRMPEADLWQLFLGERPKILGGLLTLLSFVLCDTKNIKEESPWRMVDYCRIGALTARALGRTVDEFYDAVRRNVQGQTQEIVETDSVAIAIQTFMKSREEWTGTMSDLMRAINDDCDLPDSVKKDRYWPKNHAHFSRWLNRISSSLAEIGIHIEKFPGHKGGRRIRISCDKQSSSSSSSSSNGGTVTS